MRRSCLNSLSLFRTFIILVRNQNMKFIHPTPFVNTKPIEIINGFDREQYTKTIWKAADAVCFDVDSTVCQGEAIDELADYVGHGEEIAQYTQRAMNGGLPFRQALSERLAIMKPSFSQLESYAASHPPKLTPGIKELIVDLRNRDVDVYLVSGGFRRLIVPVAQLLDIPLDHIYANVLLFDAEGNYAGFDENQLTSESGSKNVGKAGVCGHLKQKMGYKRLVMVGDGATDMEASPPADAFIGFSGNQCRESVRRGAPWCVDSFETLRDALN
ncbi:hypothetical protein AB6A40_010233 [Gnathostoma spinigerum]|uniref:Phosphoserine phosphatase n=1 Tax=Gnathostoma spinigerum TaxID=75299 RepID=A0ABD6F151_9BILA